VGTTSGGNDVSALIARLERVIQERQALIEALEAAVSGEPAATQREQLTALTREQRLVLAELVSLVPPKEAPGDIRGDTPGNSSAGPPGGAGRLLSWAP
jgi:hypothetical protein